MPTGQTVTCCHDLTLKDIDRYPVLLCRDIEAKQNRLLAIASYAQELGRSVHVLVLLPPADQLAKALHTNTPSAQGVIGMFRRPLLVPVDSFQVVGTSSGFWAPEPDLYSRLAAFGRQLRETGEKFPHLGGVFDDLGEEFQKCLTAE